MNPIYDIDGNETTRMKQAKALLSSLYSDTRMSAQALVDALNDNRLTPELQQAWKRARGLVNDDQIEEILSAFSNETKEQFRTIKLLAAAAGIILLTAWVVS
jgi:hypothetical protein